MFKSGWILGLVLIASCGVDIQSGAQQAGQSCFVPSDCADGLTCFERICVPLGAGGPNNPNNNNDNNLLDVGLDSAADADVPACVIGKYCEGNVAVTCLELLVPTVVRLECSPEEVCMDGSCVAVDGCIDADGDGYGVGCDLGPDCNDGNNRINPGARESCQTPVDDNCNGLANENCNPDGCCADGCADSEFCNTACVCQDFQPQRCESQNQPCSDLDSFVNGYYCVALGASTEGRCYGVCSTTAMDPDSTCPDPNSVCALGDPNDTSALCVSNCAFDQGCGDPALGCLPYDVGQTDGVCLPSNPNNPIGSSCDPDQFLDCAGGAICSPRANGNGGVCREACRPFAHTDGSATTDCSAGHCFAYSADIGVCLGDNMATEGERCGPQFSMCNEDAVACFPTQNGVPRCQRICRLGLSDCDPGLECFQFDPQQEDLGVCILLE